MLVTKISVEGLFYAYDYTIDLKKDSNVSIIHAPNGYGKTTVFKMIRDIFELNINELYEIPFKSFLIELSDGQSLRLEKKENSSDDMVLISCKEGSIEEFSVPPIFQNFFLDTPLIRRKRKEYFETNKALIDEIKKINKRIDVHFIETNRLYAQQDKNFLLKQYLLSDYNDIDDIHITINSPIKINERIIQCANNLKGIINQIKQNYSSNSEKLDRSFPNRLVEFVKSQGTYYDEEEIETKLKELEEKRIELEKTGFIPKGSNTTLTSVKDLDPTLKKFYTLYIKDAFEKLSCYDEIKRKIELFLEIINEKTAFSNKEMCVSDDGNICFKPKGQTTNPNNKIELQMLSSGEKHDFILFYELIFNSNKKSLFLIDEPEISLHVAWQIQYVKILEKICRINGMQAIIATHSPDIVNDREDLLISLGLEEENYG